MLMRCVRVRVHVAFVSIFRHPLMYSVYLNFNVKRDWNMFNVTWAIQFDFGSSFCLLACMFVASIIFLLLSLLQKLSPLLCSTRRDVKQHIWHAYANIEHIALKLCSLVCLFIECCEIRCLGSFTVKWIWMCRAIVAGGGWSEINLHSHTLKLGQRAHTINSKKPYKISKSLFFFICLVYLARIIK